MKLARVVCIQPLWTRQTCSCETVVSAEFWGCRLVKRRCGAVKLMR